MTRKFPLLRARLIAPQFFIFSVYFESLERRRCLEMPSERCGVAKRVAGGSDLKRAV